MLYPGRPQPIRNRVKMLCGTSRHPGSSAGMANCGEEEGEETTDHGSKLSLMLGWQQPAAQSQSCNGATLWLIVMLNSEAAAEACFRNVCPTSGSGNFAMMSMRDGRLIAAG